MKTGLVLWGGNVDTRLPVLCTLAKKRPTLRVLVSAETQPLRIEQELLEVLVDDAQLWWDYRPWDTVSQAWFLRQWVEDQGLDSVTLVTDAFHAFRSQLVCRVVLLGLRCEVHVAVAPGKGRDPVLRVVKDVGRALLLRTTGVMVRSWEAKDRRWRESLSDAAGLAAGLTGRHVRGSELV